VSRHPLFDLAGSRAVRQAKGFRKAAEDLSGAGLADLYRQEMEAAPRRHDAGGRYLNAQRSRTPKERHRNRDEEHLARALVRFCRDKDSPVALPREEGEVRWIDFTVPLRLPAAKGEQADADAPERADLVGLGPDNLLFTAKLRFLPPDASRAGVGDTPLRHLLEGLAATAAVEANRDAFQRELAEGGGATLSSDPPALVLAASPRYWDLCRRREAQKGAAWIKEMDRVAREFGDESGVRVIFAGIALEGDPGWSYDEDGPVLDAPPRWVPAWERGAGRVRPKPTPRPKGKDDVDAVVEPDLSRPVRSYGVSEHYEPGDRIEHPTLGQGVVQRVAGPQKILVRFPDREALLVHDRP